MFCPALGIARIRSAATPTGCSGLSGAAAAAHAQRRARALYRHPGHSLHRPGRVEVELEFSGEALAGVWISGQAVSIFETEIQF